MDAILNDIEYKHTHADVKEITDRVNDTIRFAQDSNMMKVRGRYDMLLVMCYYIEHFVLTAHHIT